MSSKTSFAIVAILAASALGAPLAQGTSSGLARREFSDSESLYVRAPGDHPPHHHHHHQDPNHPHHHHHHEQPLVDQSSAPAPAPVDQSQMAPQPQRREFIDTPTLTRREFYESLYVRAPGDHPPHHHHHHQDPNHPHHHHHHEQPLVDQSSAPAPAPVDQSQMAPQPQRREFIEERGFLEAIGLKARTVDLTVKQTTKMNKAKAVCESLSAKKDKKKCLKQVDKIIQLTKERNYDVEQFIKTTNHHDVFTDSDPTLSSSSSTTPTPSSSTPSLLSQKPTF